MIERFYLKDYLSFSTVELNLSSGLVVFTGPSGSGKSILINAILASLGISNCDAAVCESSVNWEIETDKFGIENNDINVFRHIKKEKSRYFINNQSLPKKAMAQITSQYLRHLNLKDFSDFSNENLLDILDKRIALRDTKIIKLKEQYQTNYLAYIDIKQKLQKIEEQEKKLIELKEFAAFEIAKIENINPKESEDLELMEIKKELSKKEKVLQNLQMAQEIFNFEHHISNVLDLLDVDSSFFSDTMNELRAIFDNTQERFSALDEIDIEEVLNRIEELSNLKRRYGSIKEALVYKEEKKQELEKYENIEFEKTKLQKEYDVLSQNIAEYAHELTQIRKDAIDEFRHNLNEYLQALYLRECDVTLDEIDYNLYGKDKIEISLNATPLQKISTGEFNRLRLAILALKSENMISNGGILVLDEIDANLSGEESMSVAKVLKQLSKYFQIFVISHQPQLTSMGDQHFFVYKQKNQSFVKELNKEERVNEIARIISGESISQEAKRFAQELLGVG